MKVKLRLFLKGAVLLLLFFSPILKAQESTIVRDSINTAFLPALSYNSDFGLMVGGLTNRYHYSEGQNPFYSYLSVAAVISTKGLATGQVRFDKPNAFGKDLRLVSEIYVSRFFEDYYFGVGNYAKLDNTTSTSNPLYLFQSFSAGFEMTFRMPLLRGFRGKRLEALGIFNFDYQTPWDNTAENLIVLEQPIGYDGGRTLHLGTGIIWEGRDNEFRPSRGQYFESSLQVSQKWLGSSFDTAILEADARHYFSFFLIRDITFAQRLYAKHTTGEVPYWKLAYAGNDETMRGYPARRFLDDNALILNSELRTWLFNIDAIKGEFGGTLFFDMGRTFPNGASIQTISEDIKYTFGFGATSSFFTPDFILRTDVGFSEEGTGIYFTAGYMF